MVEIREAKKAQAAEIARLIMMAMTDDCCLHFCGDGHGLDDFREMMTALVAREDSQYSYRNTLVAMDGETVVGIPAGEAFYASVGFRYANDSQWGGHPMKHLVL